MWQRWIGCGDRKGSTDDFAQRLGAVEDEQPAELRGAIPGNDRQIMIA
jgi:hypothetical protein